MRAEGRGGEDARQKSARGTAAIMMQTTPKVKPKARAVSLVTTDGMCCAYLRHCCSYFTRLAQMPDLS